MKGETIIKRLIALPVALVLFGLLLPFHAQAQTKEDGLRLLKEADELRENVRSAEDRKASMQKYEQVLSIFQKLGYREGLGVALKNLGNLYLDLGQAQKALELYEKGLVAAKAIGDRNTEALILNNLGNVYKEFRQNEKAMSLYEECIALSRQVKERKGEAIALTNLGGLYEQLGNFEKALECYDKAVPISRESKNQGAEARILNGSGLVHWKQGRYDRALDCFEKALGMYRDLKDRQGEGACLGNLGHVYWEWGKYDRAVGYYDKCLTIFRDLKDPEGQGRTLTHLGNAYSDWGMYEKSVDCYEKGLRMARDFKDRPGEGISLNNLGLVFLHRGQYDKAVDYLEKSLAIKKDLKDRLGEGQTLNNLGNIYLYWGRYSKAVDCYEKCLATARDLRDRKGEGVALNNLGIVYRDWGQYDRAADYFEKSLAIKRELKNRSGEAEALLNLGVAFQHRGGYKSALENFQKGLAICRQINSPTDRFEGLIADTYMDIGDLSRAEPLLKGARIYNGYRGRYCLLIRDYPKAKEYYEQILKSANENQDVHALFTAYTGLAAASEGPRDDVSAAEYYEKAVKYTEELRSSLNPSERERFFDVRINGFYRTAPYEGLARVLMRQNKPQEAFKTSEYTRARVFSEAMSRMSEGKNLAVPPDILKQDASITNELAALKKNLQKGYEKNDKLVIESLEPQVEQLERKLQTHIEMLREKYPLFAATKYPQPMDLSQTDLTDNEWVVAYHVTDPGVIMYMIKGKDVVKGLFKPIPRKEVDELVRRFREPMEIGPGDSVAKKLASFDFASGKKLADLLLSDILSDLPKDNPAIIVPDGSLGVVPFEMLVLTDGGKVMTDKNVPYTVGAEFFGDRNPISYYQSITALTLARTLSKPQKAGDKLLAMVDPVFSSDDPRLTKLAKNEKDKLLGALPKELLMSIQTESGLTFSRLPLTGQLGESLKTADAAHTDLFEGTTAKKSVLLEKDLTQYRSLVFGTHGYFGKDLPGIQEPVLVLSLVGEPKDQDGFLRLSEVMGLKTNCDIAALTACQTGLGRHVSGEGTMGMGRAFQYSGAKSVLMSLWSVAESSSVKLVENFFKHIKEGKSKMEALRLARDEIRKAGYDHPFFWAPFILVGEAE